MKAISLETNRRGYSMAIAKEITLQETQGLKAFAITFLATIALSSMIFYMVVSQVKIHALEAENAQLEEYINTITEEQTQTEAEYNSTIKSLKSNITSSNKVINALDSEVTTLKSDNKSLAKEYDDLLSNYNVLASRKELYDKYEYVITYGGKRTDVTYDQIKSGVEIMKENGYDPNILFSTIMVESRGLKDAANSQSTARGYGQLLRGTAKFVYEDIMKNGNGSYDHSMAFDGNLNIKMTAYYLTDLLERKDGNLFATMRNYSGRNDLGTNSYISMMNGFSSTTGTNMFYLCELMD